MQDAQPRGSWLGSLAPDGNTRRKEALFKGQSGKLWFPVFSSSERQQQARGSLGRQSPSRLQALNMVVLRFTRMAVCKEVRIPQSNASRR